MRVTPYLRLVGIHGQSSTSVIGSEVEIDGLEESTDIEVSHISKLLCEEIARAIE